VYDLQFPDYLSGYENETEAKGYLVGVKVVSPDATFDLTVYDPFRLGQDVAEEVRSDSYFTATNLLVVPSVNRTEITRAVERLSRSRFQGLLPRGNM